MNSDRRQFLLRSTSQFMKNFAGGNGLTAKQGFSGDKKKEKGEGEGKTTSLIAGLDLHLPKKHPKQKIADQFSPYIDTLPKYLYNIKCVNLESHHHENDVLVTSSGAIGSNHQSDSHNPFMPDAYGKSISTYPHFSGNEKQEGHPICDVYSVTASRTGAVCVIADGCGWGERPKAAAQRAVHAFTEYLAPRVGKLKDIHHASSLLLKAFRESHQSVLGHAHAATGADVRAECNECTKCGTTTLLGGILLPLESHPLSDDRHPQPRWAFVCCSIGDCKAFVYSNRRISEVTVGSRHATADATDCGGRLGPQLEMGNPDLRNLQLFFHPLNEGDILLLCSDGVHDNFDPEHLGKTPKDVGLTAHADWASVDPEEASQIKDLYRGRYLEDLLLGSKELDEVVDKLLIHSKAITAASRFWMEQNRTRLPNDYSRFPGKMDHTTCVAIRVPLQTYAEAYNK